MATGTNPPDLIPKIASPTAVEDSECQLFFETVRVPDQYDAKETKINNFVSVNRSKGRKIVLVSSGGTTVPLESRTVRYIDNFSVGTRGSTSAEHFLEHGYAVIFLHRKGSLEPYRRHFTQTNFLDMLQVPEDSSDVTILPDHIPKVKALLGKYSKVKADGSLLLIDFTTLSEYLFLLKGSAQALQGCGAQAMFYLAAAVSDFYIPATEMPEHKIQSADGPLQISLKIVPKMLQPLVSQWAPQAYIVSFKLETDPAILVPKARGALERYRHQIVVGNILETRKKEVILVTRQSEQPIVLTDEELQAGTEIEERIVGELAERHTIFTAQQEARA